MVDFLIVILLLIILRAAIIYIVKAKKSGAKCIGCPAGGNCTQGSKACGECHCKGESTWGCHSDTK